MRDNNKKKRENNKAATTTPANVVKTETRSSTPPPPPPNDENLPPKTPKTPLVQAHAIPDKEEPDLLKQGVVGLLHANTLQQQTNQTHQQQMVELRQDFNKQTAEHNQKWEELKGDVNGVKGRKQTTQWHLLFLFLDIPPEST